MGIFGHSKPVNEAQPKRRSVLGFLFNPQLGNSISPLRESTRIFVQLIAAVFAIYKLIPKDYPGLRDDAARLSLRHVIGTAWQNLRLTRDGAPQAIIFFAVIGVMGVSALAAVSFMLSLFVGHAHAQAAGASAFAPESQDIAQAWLDFLFNNTNGNYPSPTISFADGMNSSMNDPFQGSVSIQGALSKALAFYSDAILIVAAIMLFYYLASMVVETAHHGVPMGKRASQIWAPIRLVVAIGLLVPINGGLSSGQYIVIKVAELGSGLASHTWDIFLDQLVQGSTALVPPPAPSVQWTAFSVINMEACTLAWNTYAAQSITYLPKLNDTLIQPPSSIAVNSTFSYSSNDAKDAGICGQITIPATDSNSDHQAAASVEASVLSSSLGTFRNAANVILPLLEQDVSAGTTAPPPAQTIQLDQTVVTAVEDYQHNLDDQFSHTFSNNQAGQLQAVKDQIEPLGWVMAGAYLNTISRIQGLRSSASSAGIPQTTEPNYRAMLDEEEGESIRHKVAKAMENLAGYEVATINKYRTDAKQIACAGMFGGAGSSPTPSPNSASDEIFKLVNAAVIHEKVWQDAKGDQCGSSVNGAASNKSTFKVGVQFQDGQSQGSDGETNKDPFSQMVFLGHANLHVANTLIEDALIVSAGSGAVGELASYQSKARSSILTKFGQGAFATLAHLGAAATPILSFLAVAFWTMGFTLAFLLPLMPFMRFFFAVLAWVAAIIEAVIAIPLVALAHLNPEGEGLSGQQAKASYFFIFNLFLRPVLTVFGLICGLIVFLVAVSFLNLGYGVAVGDGGGTVEQISTIAFITRLLYQVLYVVILYICANHAFQLIEQFPETAMSWFGGQGQKVASMGNTERIDNIATTISSLAGQQAIGALTSGAKELGSAGGAVVNAGRGAIDAPKVSLKEQNDTLRGLANSSRQTHQDFVNDPRNEGVLKNIYGDNFDRGAIIKNLEKQ